MSSRTIGQGRTAMSSAPRPSALRAASGRPAGGDQEECRPRAQRRRAATRKRVGAAVRRRWRIGKLKPALQHSLVAAEPELAIVRRSTVILVANLSGALAAAGAPVRLLKSALTCSPESARTDPGPPLHPSAANTLDLQVRSSQDCAAAPPPNGNSD